MESYQHTKKVTIISALLNSLLAIVKVFVGMMAQSHALVADGIHSFSDLLSDFLVLLAAKYSSRQADWDHPYGHARIETAATLGLALFIILAGISIVADSMLRLSQNELQIPQQAALWVAAISVGVNEWLYQYTLKVGRAIGSTLLIANAWHNRSDAASSIAVVIGVGASLCGYPLLDSLSAIVVAALIIKMGASLGWSSVKELVDTGLDKGTLAEIKQTIAAVPGVHSLHCLRSRSMAGKVLIDVHILVASYLSVSEGHFIGVQVERALLKNYSQISDVTLHIDPEDDETEELNERLPTREQLIKVIKCDDDSIKLTIHYLNGMLEVDVFLTQHSERDISQIRQQLLAIPEVKMVTVWNEIR